MNLRDVWDFLGVLFSHKRRQPRAALTTPRQQEFAVIGLGRFGSSVALTLVSRGHTVLGIDSDPALVQQYSDEITQTVSLDSTDEDALRDIDIGSYETVIVAIGSQFEANVMTTVALKMLGVRRVICKVATQRQHDILRNIGADEVVLPEHESGVRVAERLATPGVVGSIRLNNVHIVSEVQVPTKYVGKTLEEVGFQERYGTAVVAIGRREQFVANPPPDLLLKPDDVLVVIAEEHQVVRLIFG
jgi:trk system potassium uptake protein